MPVQLRALAAPPRGFSSDAVQVILWGTSANLSFNAAGGASVRNGPWDTSCLRLAIGAAQNVRVNVGDGTVVATSASALFVGPGVEHIAIQPGQYVAAISDDAGTGSLNITEAL